MDEEGEEQDSDEGFWGNLDLVRTDDKKKINHHSSASSSKQKVTTSQKTILQRAATKPPPLPPDNKKTSTKESTISMETEEICEEDVSLPDYVKNFCKNHSIDEETTAYLLSVLE